MKIWIDKHGGMHYHKRNCPIIHSEIPPIFKYEAIEHIIRRLGQPYYKEYATIKVEGRIYSPCPFCFGNDKRRSEGFVK
jgi:hypothetical protein